MVNEFRKLCFPGNYAPVTRGIIRYDATDEERISKIELSEGGK